MEFMKFSKSVKINPLLITSVLILLSITLTVGFLLGGKYQNRQVILNTQQNSQLNDYKQDNVDKNPDNLTTTTVPQILPTDTPSSNIVTYLVPKTWSRITMSSGLALCLPPKWEVDQWGNVYFNRDSAYRPNVTYIQEIPYQERSRRESFYIFWEKEYPSVRQTVGINEVLINKSTALKFSGPEGDKIVWLANGKLWQAGISGWSMVNDSKAVFLKDFYTMISCSF